MNCNLPVILSLGLCNGMDVVRRSSNGGLAALGSSISGSSLCSVVPDNPIRGLCMKYLITNQENKQIFLILTLEVDHIQILEYT